MHYDVADLTRHPRLGSCRTDDGWPTFAFGWQMWGLEACFPRLAEEIFSACIPLAMMPRSGSENSRCTCSGMTTKPYKLLSAVRMQMICECASPALRDEIA